MCSVKVFLKKSALFSENIFPKGRSNYGKVNTGLFYRADVNNVVASITGVKQGCDFKYEL